MSCPKYKLRLYKNRDEMSSYIMTQCMELRDKASLYYHTNFEVPARISHISVFVDWNSYFTDENMRLITAEIGSGEKRKVIGKICCHVDESKIATSKNTCYVSNIWVEPQYRKFGIASALAREMFRLFPDGEFHIHIYDKNVIGQKFWASVGFVDKFTSEYILNWEGENNNEND